MAEWFGLDDPVRCSEFGPPQIFDNDLGRLRPARPTEKVPPVFLGMPQGWSWALHFCTTSVKHFTSAAIGGKHRLVQEGLPAPDLRSCLKRLRGQPYHCGPLELRGCVGLRGDQEGA
eukprot:9404103-Pyramimonas_sp.AAC.1